MLVINATAAREGGALTILTNVLLLCEKRGISSCALVNQHVIDMLLGLVDWKYVRFEPVIDMSGWQRIEWDFLGFNRKLKKLNLNVDTILSLQNTLPKTDVSCKKISYLHQPIPIYDYSWNLFKKSERKLWFYKHVYPYFMRMNRSNDVIYCVQGEWMVSRFAKLLGVLESQFLVSAPINKDFLLGVRQERGEEYSSFFYPAHFYSYKNHKILVQAVLYISEHYPDLLGKLRVDFTIDANTGADLLKENNALHLRGCFVFSGGLSYEQVQNKYLSSYGLLFPSLLETFGLPLIEAARVGCPIVVSDLPYAREVLRDYKCAQYCKTKESWAEAIVKLLVRSEALNCKWSPDQLFNNGWDKLIKGLE